ncbi:hypothetical protein DSO57_1038525 [Entomophthora muscae]|uniref:Uncharacterized protein n=1 Tax=Entomophthora muscae TaxID=34485 RepID=A0ACC2TKV8_9FUNG|nr:hypothetical protein DSO57_1038525 [Entomophthora muscae]
MVRFSSRKQPRCTKSQLKLLESFYSTKPTPTPKDIAILARNVKLKARQVCAWLRNRRSADSSLAAPVNKMSLSCIVHNFGR